MAPRPRVFTVPASVPFLPTLIAALRDGTLTGVRPDDPIAFARMTLFLPTRRACRQARDAFLDVPGLRAAVLPRIAAIGDIDEDEFVFADVATGGLAAQALDLPPPISAFERRILLAKLVQQWARSPDVQRPDGALVVASPIAALALADDLARLLDDLASRQVPWEALERLVPEGLDQYWALTLGFLKVARVHWPDILAARGVIEPAVRRDRLIEAEAARLAANADGPVIAAGSTGSIPVTAKLLATIAALPHGAVVLPGLDVDLEDDAWEAIGRADAPDQAGGMPAAGHPQFAMHGLLRRIGISRAQVGRLGPPAGARDLLVSEALRPAASTDRWPARLAAPGIRERIDAALADITVIEAATADEEALAVAVALREAIEDPGATAALVTPDRALAGRVTAAFARWNVPVDDSGGEPVGETPPGVFARLAAETALAGVAPVSLLALLKHPLCGLAVGADAAVATLELAILRGPRPRPGTSGLAHALATFRQAQGSLHRSDLRRRLSAADLDQAADLVARLAGALAPLEELGPAERALADLAERHRSVIDRLGLVDIPDPFGEDEDAVALEALLDELGAPRESDLELRPRDYPELFTLALTERVVRRRPTGAPVRIYGLLEARLQSVDRAVLGGLVEGVWPPQPRGDPWLSRPMRHALGLDLPERRIGLSAHDFAQALGTRQVVLTRAGKREGAPTVPSRFVQRLAAVAGTKLWQQACARGQVYLDLARALDRPARVEPVRQPAPSPPLAARPTRLSVSDIEDLLRDPYTIYAKHILRLAPLDPVDTPPGAADRGSVIHAAIERFTREHAARLPADPLAALVALGRAAFAPLEDYPEARAFWWPRFLRIARWFTVWESERRARLTGILTEERGAIDIAAGARVVRLSARADRIDRLSDGRYAILDYKTGQAPSGKQVNAGLAPQLTLEGAILRQGGFAAIAAGGSIAEMAYVQLRGGVPAGEFKPIEFKDSDANSQADKALRRLTEVLTRFESEPYRSLVAPMWTTRYGDYDHLARVKEWSAAGGAAEGGGEP